MPGRCPAAMGLTHSRLLRDRRRHHSQAACRRSGRGAVLGRLLDSPRPRTFPPTYPYEDFKGIYLHAFERNLKGCTTFRFNPSAFQGVLVKEKDLENTTYRFTLEDGTVVEARGNEDIEYDGDVHTAANLYDAIKEGYYGQILNPAACATGLRTHPACEKHVWTGDGLDRPSRNRRAKALTDRERGTGCRTPRTFAVGDSANGGRVPSMSAGKDDFHARGQGHGHQDQPEDRRVRNRASGRGIRHAAVPAQGGRHPDAREDRAAETLLGSTYKIKTPLSDHALYVTINDVVLNAGTEHEQRRPFEIFINSKNMEHFQWIVALTRIVSAVFRRAET